MNSWAYLVNFPMYINYTFCNYHTVCPFSINCQDLNDLNSTSAWERNRSICENSSWHNKSNVILIWQLRMLCAPTLAPGFTMTFSWAKNIPGVGIGHTWNFHKKYIYLVCFSRGISSQTLSHKFQWLQRTVVACPWQCSMATPHFHTPLSPVIHI